MDTVNRVISNSSSRISLACESRDCLTAFVKASADLSLLLPLGMLVDDAVASDRTRGHVAIHAARLRSGQEHVLRTMRSVMRGIFNFA